MAIGMFKQLQPSQMDWARLAAYVDGEGCIRIGKGAQGSNRGTQHYLVISVAQVDRRLIDWLCQNFGGSAVLNRKTNPKQRPCWFWKICGGHAEWCLKGMLPYLICKRDQAEIGLEFRETFHLRHTGPGRPMPQDVLDKRDSCRERITALKHIEFPELQVS